MLFQEQDFVETKLATKFAEFLIRVYKDTYGKETLVLWTENLDFTQPVLTRVHSECLTGDMLGSLHCDCGQQLTKSLQMISENGGMLIYLRQEGRGIGLFEKMQTYVLQSKGHDTFEANTLLGHKPDQRSYEMVKKVLNDLHVDRIKLITNNPSKVSEISKLGIEVVGRVPMISEPNKHNKAYLETKKRKFQHFLDESTKEYLYQIPIENSDELQAIKQYFASKKKDPLLKLGIAISANHSSLHSEKEIKRIASILEICQQEKDLLSPSVHFSFFNSPNVLEDVKKIKEIWPELSRIQINDLPEFKIDVLTLISDAFDNIDIPLSDDTFDIVYDRQFQNLVEDKLLYISLDNSKGKGIQEPKNSYIKKIDALLELGLNNIILCGGFGPDKLTTYFHLRRYYRINFSIDAETNLKNNGKVDIEKIKLYLHQLIRFDDPNPLGTEQTKEFLKKIRRSTWETANINGVEFVIHPKVFHAGQFPSTSWFASELCEIVKNDSNFCEVGCGSGVISCLLALENPLLSVIATDINPFASENTQLNAKRHNLLSRIHTFNGDVLDSIDPDQKFDSIFWALPFGFLDPGVEINLEETQVFDPGYRAIRKFFKSVRKYMKPNGRILLGFSSDLGHPTLLEEIASEFSIKLTTIKQQSMKETTQVKFEIIEGNLN